MKYKSCNLIQHGLCFFNEMLVSCCFAPCDQINGQMPPIICENYKGEILEKEFLFNKIREYSSIFKNGGCPKECTNCYHIEEKEWDEAEYINSITITHFSKCNADCIYCSNNLEKEDRTNDMYNIMPVLHNMKDKGILKQGCELHIGGGEFTIYKECDELLNEFALSGFAKVLVPTNAIHYSEKLYLAMEKTPASIIVSLDSGTRKTFEKIKRVDAFDKVIQNLKSYSKTEEARKSISLKYIIIPTINDNLKEFKAFLKIAKTLQIEKIIIDIDARYSRLLNHKIDIYLINYTKKIKKIAENMGFETETYSFLTQCENTAENTQFNFIKNIKSFIKYRFFNAKAKQLYSSHVYGMEKVKRTKNK